MEKTYTCKIHQDVRVSSDDYGHRDLVQGEVRCHKCGRDLIPIEATLDVACFVCQRSIALTKHNLKDQIYGMCPICKTVYNIQLTKKEG